MEKDINYGIEKNLSNFQNFEDSNPKLVDIWTLKLLFIILVEKNFI